MHGPAIAQNCGFGFIECIQSPMQPSKFGMFKQFGFPAGGGFVGAGVAGGGISVQVEHGPPIQKAGFGFIWATHIPMQEFQSGWPKQPGGGVGAGVAVQDASLGPETELAAIVKSAAFVQELARQAWASLIDMITDPPQP